ncbi:metallophosphoesterase family protein [Streptomyces uncialis]|uniref:metallophosphoesterase family protein n=1 Tax=Streptomyces uncialis TaxID=1048205 RepID=UPI00225B156E|nr:metallophosphoesterase [Streptomyces uncialis]MCX4657979.1 metallophosphoesterase [Streptomyces uncialis]WTE15086.1 metallophosphoesterase [Streptomyces uncialis]
MARLYAVSDLHVAHPENRAVVEGLFPEDEGDWLLLAGDVGELAADVEWTLRLLADRFSTVVWVPGNHELWTHPADPVRLRGEHRYRYLVELCRRLGVITPEDPYPIWTGPGGPVTVVPLFLLYDYSFLPPGVRDVGAALALAEAAGVVCSDEFLLHPDPYPTRADWCRARVVSTEARLAGCDPALPTLLVNHFPLVREPTEVLHHPEFALWCGTTASRDWPVRYRASAVIYGHLHIPRTIHTDGVRHQEVSLGYPREWRRWGKPDPLLREVFPAGEQR